MPRNGCISYYYNEAYCLQALCEQGSILQTWIILNTNMYKKYIYHNVLDEIT